MVLYLHGFNSSPQSFKSRLLGEVMAMRGLAASFVCPFLPHWPGQAMDLAQGIIEQSTPPVTLVGSSMGGFYATYLAEKYGLKAVLVNPAVAPGKLLVPLLGPQENYHTGERYDLTSAHLDQFAALDVPVTRPERYLVLLASGDEVLDHRDALNKYPGSRLEVVQGGDHSFAMFEDYIPRILSFAGLLS